MFHFLFPSVSNEDVKEALTWRLWQVYALFMDAACFSSWMITVHESKRDVSAIAAVVFVLIAVLSNYLLLRITSTILMQDRLEKEALIQIDQ